MPQGRKCNDNRVFEYVSSQLEPVPFADLRREAEVRESVDSRQLKCD